MVNAIILCAGYGTRLAKDLQQDKTDHYKHLIGIPKPLLPINGLPLISYWIKIFEKTNPITNVKIITNEAHKKSYESYVKEQTIIHKKVHLVSDGSYNNETRTGAVACMHLGSQDSNEDMLIVAGDTLFDQSFVLDEMISKFMALKEKNKKVALIVSAPVKPEDVPKHGIIEVNETGQVSSFLEKPQLDETSSRLQSPCCYLISRPCVELIRDFLEETEEEPFSSRDATGNFIKYLVTRVPTFAFPVRRRFDIGGLQSYIDCYNNYS